MTKKSHTLKKLSAVVGSLGVCTFLLGWWAEYRGFVFGFESRVWYNDAIILLLIAIWLKLGAIYHKEEKGTM